MDIRGIGSPIVVRVLVLVVGFGLVLWLLNGPVVALVGDVAIVVTITVGYLVLTRHQRKLDDAYMAKQRLAPPVAADIPPPPPDTALTKCPFCGVTQPFGDKCTNCGAPLPKPI